MRKLIGSFLLAAFVVAFAVLAHLAEREAAATTQANHYPVNGQLTLAYNVPALVGGVVALAKSETVCNVDTGATEIDWSYGPATWAVDGGAPFVGLPIYQKTCVTILTGFPNGQPRGIYLNSTWDGGTADGGIRWAESPQ